MTEPPVAPDDTPTRPKGHSPARNSRKNLQYKIDRLEAEVSRLREALKQWESWGIIEIAVRNQSVSEYMDHWEGRALKAEAEVSRLREEMSPLYNTEQWLRWCDIRVLERAETAEAEVSRLQQENAQEKLITERAMARLTEAYEEIERLKARLQAYRADHDDCVTFEQESVGDNMEVEIIDRRCDLCRQMDIQNTPHE